MIPGLIPAPCESAPTITSITKTEDELLACIGALKGWHLRWTVVITGTLQAGQEYYWEAANNAAGDNWAYWRRGTAAYQDKYDVTIGSTGGGASTTVYHRVRAYVVPVDVDPPSQCSGPTTSSQADRTANACAE